MIHAGSYSATLHFLKAVPTWALPAAKKSGAAIVDRDEGDADRRRRFQGKIREDGRGLFPAYLFQVKKPAESKGQWDYYKLVRRRRRRDEAWRPLADGHCSYREGLVHKSYERRARTDRKVGAP